MKWNEMGGTAFTGFLCHLPSSKRRNNPAKSNLEGEKTGKTEERNTVRATGIPSKPLKPGKIQSKPR